MKSLILLDRSGLTGETVETRKPDEAVMSQVVAIFSREGPPYIELIQSAHDNSVFSEANADQILYVAVWNSDIPARVDALKELGVGFEALLDDSGGVPFVCLTKPEALEGVRIEFVAD